MKIKIFLTLLIISVLSFLIVSYKKIFFYIGFNESIEINNVEYFLNESNLYTLRKPLQYKQSLFYPSYEYSEYDNNNCIVYINGMYTKDTFSYPLLQECKIDSIVLLLDSYIEINSNDGQNSILLDKFTIEENITLNDICLDINNPVKDIKNSDIKDEYTLYFSFYVFEYLTFNPNVSLCFVKDKIYIRFFGEDIAFYQVTDKYFVEWIDLFTD